MHQHITHNRSQTPFSPTHTHTQIHVHRFNTHAVFAMNTHSDPHTNMLVFMNHTLSLSLLQLEHRQEKTRVKRETCERRAKQTPTYAFKQTTRRSADVNQRHDRHGDAATRTRRESSEIHNVDRSRAAGISDAIASDSKLRLCCDSSSGAKPTLISERRRRSPAPPLPRV